MDIAPKTRKNRFLRALPPSGPIILASLFWALSIALICALSWVYLAGWGWTDQLVLVTAIYASGALLAVWPSAFLARFIVVSIRWKRIMVFAILLILGTLFFTSIIFALQYRLYFSSFHAHAFSRIWMWQQFYTAAGAVYTYLVMGVRLYFPFALIPLFVTSWWVNRLPD